MNQNRDTDRETGDEDQADQDHRDRDDSRDRAERGDGVLDFLEHDRQPARKCGVLKG